MPQRQLNFLNIDLIMKKIILILAAILVGGYDLAGVNVFYDPRNKKDFKASTLPVLTPLEFFNRIDSK